MTAPNLIVSIAGLPKSGKTHLALSFPEPLTVFSFDIGIEPVLVKYSNKVVDVKTYPIPIIDSVRPKPYAKDLWNAVIADYKKALAESKTVVIDTATALWELARHAYTEELGQKQLMPIQYGEVNARMTAILTQPRVTGVNFVLTHYLRDVYVNDKATGELELDGFKRTEGLVDIVLRTARKTRPATQEERKAANKSSTNVIVTTITDCRYDLDLCGYEVENCSYDLLLALLGIGG